MIENLKELVSIISLNKVKKVDIISNQSIKSKTRILYDGIRKGQFTTEEDAAFHFYGKGGQESVNYKKLKGRLQKHLINSVFFLDINQPAYNEFQKAYYNCYKDWAAVKILLGRSARRSAISIAERVFNIARANEFSDLILDIARILRNHYGTIVGDKDKYYKYNTYVNKYKEIINAELLAEEYFQDIAVNYVSKKAEPDIGEKSIRYSQELRPYTGKVQSYKLNLYGYLVHTLRYEVNNDYDKMLEECKTAIQYFESKTYNGSKNAIFTFLFKMLSCHIQLKKFENGKEIAEQCLQLSPNGSPNWFFTLEQFQILALHAEWFQNAYEIFCTATTHKSFKTLYRNSAEKWTIYEAYLQYFISIGKIKPEISLIPKVKKFQVTRFLNKVPRYSKDKRGMNIPILIIQVLFLLQRKKFDAVILRVEALNQYCYRYLRKNDTYRSNCFIKMLLTLSKANFHRQGVIRKTDKYLHKLVANPMNLRQASQTSEVEIIPYETLWEYVLDSLDNKFYRI